jgi:glutathione S-transferase
MNQALELWQTEWCPSSHRVRQRLTELGLTFTAHQVPAQHEARRELIHVSGHDTIPVLRSGGDIVTGSDAILTYLDDRYPEPEGAAEHQARAAEFEHPHGGAEDASACAVR